jgi:hypothetical protein
MKKYRAIRLPEPQGDNVWGIAAVDPSGEERTLLAFPTEAEALLVADSMNASENEDGARYA